MKKIAFYEVLFRCSDMKMPAAHSSVNMMNAICIVLISSPDSMA